MQGYYSKMRMRQRRRKQAVALAASLALVLSCTAVLHRPAQLAVSASAPAPAPTGYIAKSEHNLIVIYRNGEQEPMLFTNIDVRSLPASDQALLEQGYALEDADDISRLLEDYGS